MHILSLIVTYYPDLSTLQKNIDAFSTDVDKLVIWDNTPQGTDFSMLTCRCELEIISSKENKGLSYAYNVGVAKAKNEGYTHFLTMDQDSYWNGFDQYIKEIINKDEDAIYTPPINCKTNIETKEILWGINSGCLTSINLLEEIGGYRNDFFIDGIDTEMHFRAKKYGYKIYCVGKCWLTHTYAEPSAVKFLWRTVYVNNYSAMRYYGIFRNHIRVWREFEVGKTYKKLWFKYFRRHILNIIVGERNKMKKLKAVSLGILDGLLDNKSRIAIFK